MHYVVNETYQWSIEAQNIEAAKIIFEDMGIGDGERIDRGIVEEETGNEETF